MIRRGFWKGLLAGGLIGAALSMMSSPQRKPGPAKRIMGKTRKVQDQAQRVFRGVKDGINDLMKE